MAETERDDPHDSQVMKKRRLSFVRSVSGDLHVLQVTYSTVENGKGQSSSSVCRWMGGDVPIYRRRTFSICSEGDEMRPISIASREE